MTTIRELSARSMLSLPHRVVLERARRHAWNRPDGDGAFPSLPPGVVPVVAATLRGDGVLCALGAALPNAPTGHLNLDQNARSALDVAARVATEGIEALGHLLDGGRFSLDSVAVEGDRSPRVLRGASLGLSAALAAWSRMIGVPFPVDLAASAVIDEQGRLHRVGYLRQKSRLLKGNALAVKRILVSREQDPEDLQAITEEGLEPLPVETLGEAVRVVWPEAPARISVVAETLARRWSNDPSDLDALSRAALLHRLDGRSGQALRLARSAMILHRHPASPTARDSAVEVTLALAVGDLHRAGVAAARLGSVAPSHPLAAGPGFLAHRRRVIAALITDVREPDEVAPRYDPRPIDTSGVALPDAFHPLIERLAENNHDHWARDRMGQGWRLGPRSEADRTNPCLVPYDELPEQEREYDRKMAVETLKSVLALGFTIVPPARSQDG